MKSLRKFGGSLTKDHVTSMFPLAKPNGPISTELTGVWEKRRPASKDHRQPQDIPSYEKVCVFSIHNYIICNADKETDSFGFSFEHC